MRDAVINAKLDDFWIDHQKTDLVRRRIKEQGNNDGIDAHRFSGAGRAGDQQVRHFSDVGNRDIARDIASECNRQLAFRLGKFARVKDFTDGNRAHDLIGHLDADGGLIGNRRFDAHARRGEVEGDVVGKPGNPADFDSG